MAERKDGRGIEGTLKSVKRESVEALKRNGKRCYEER
jgi:hypothetical protein